MRKFTVFFVCLASWTLACAQTYVWDNGKIELAMSACGIRFTKIPTENFSTLGSVIEMNNYLYNLMGMDKSYRNRLACGYQGYNTDIEIVLKSQADFAIYNVGTGTGDLSVSNGRDPWTYLAKMVYNSSAIIDGLKQHCDTTKPAFAYCLGEALFLRAFALSEMVKLWGDIPTSWKMYGGFVVPTNPKQDRNLVYEAIRSDLKRASNLLPWSDLIPSFNRSSSLYREPTSETSLEDIYMEHPGNCTNYTGAPSKAAALALLARIDLNYAGYAMKPYNLGVPADGFGIQLNVVDSEKRRSLYQEALESCAQILQREGDQKFLANFEDVFKKVCADETNYFNSEVIWEIPFADGTRGQFLNSNCTKVVANSGGSTGEHALKNFHGSSTYTGTLSYVGLSPTLYYDYEEGDRRRDVTITPFSWYYNEGRDVTSDPEKINKVFPEVNTESNEKFLYQRFENVNKWYLGKYRIEWMGHVCNMRDDGVNVPIIRMADVMLMFCEASIGGITGDVPNNSTGLSAQAQFDKIRARAGVTSKPLTMANLMDERKFEFAGEALRKYDLIRWGKLRENVEKERVRLDSLDSHTGKFAATSDTVYIKYRYVGDTYSQAGQKGYIIDYFTHQRPSDYETGTGWFRKCIYSRYDGSDRYLSRSNYLLYMYDHPEYLDSHQLWPIFDVNIQTSNGLLWNDYNY